jgi:hypothetical protein
MADIEAEAVKGGNNIDSDMNNPDVEKASTKIQPGFCEHKFRTQQKIKAHKILSQNCICN